LNKDTFSNFITHPGRISTPDVPLLEVFAEQFPYCQLAHFFAAKPHFDRLTAQAEGKVQRAAIYAISRYKLKKFLELPSQYISENRDNNTPLPPSLQAAEAETAPSPFDELLAQPDLSAMPLLGQEQAANLNTTAVQATDIPETDIENFNEKIKKLKQTEIIDQFIKTEPRITSASALDKEAPTKDLAEKSIKAPAELVSENLANIMRKQGKTDKAIEIYEKLMLKYPEKKSYFAEKIESLKIN
jgi:tetratricopeptide (TPR) repeat protein